MNFENNERPTGSYALHLHGALPVRQPGQGHALQTGDARRHPAGDGVRCHQDKIHPLDAGRHRNRLGRALGVIPAVRPDAVGSRSDLQRVRPGAVGLDRVRPPAEFGIDPGVRQRLAATIADGALDAGRDVFAVPGSRAGSFPGRSSTCRRMCSRSCESVLFTEG